jgi:hypothetical protein
MSSGLDELERRGRWGRNAPPAPRPPTPPTSRPPARAEPAEAQIKVPTRVPPRPKLKTAPAQRAATKPIPEAPATGVERVVIYLSPEQTAWIRERQIEGLRAGKRVTTSKLVRDLLDRAMR